MALRRIPRFVRRGLPLALALMIGVSVAIAAPAGASHFRYGNSTWKSLGGNSVQFTVDDGFRRSGYTLCYDSTTNTVTKPCTGSDGYPAVGDIISEDIGETEFAFGDGTSATPGPDGSLLFLVDSIDPANDVLQGRALNTTVLPTISTAITHTYTSPGNYVAFTDSCCRVNTLQGGNAGGNYRVETLVDAGAGNSAPTSNLPDVVTCVEGQVCNFQIPRSDPDGDATTVRFPTAVEDDSLIQPPGATVSSGGSYSWDNTSLANPIGLWATQVAIEDHAPGGAVKSKTSVDFIINLVAPSGGNTAPAFTQTNPACGSVVQVTVSHATQFTVTSADANGADTVTLNATGLPTGSTTSPTLPTTSAPGSSASATFNWTPAAGDVGDHVITFQATDPSNYSSLCSITLRVATPTTPPASGQPKLDTVRLGYRASPTSGVSVSGVSTSVAGELLVALVQADGPANGTQTVRSVAGAGLTWVRASYADLLGAGANEVWYAYSPTRVSGATVAATFATPANGAITVESFTGAAHALGAVGIGSQPSGPTSRATLTPQSSNSLVIGGQLDWSSATKPVPAAGQALTTYVGDATVGDEYSTHTVTAATVAGTPVSVTATVPRADRWSTVAVEVPPAS